MSKKHSDKSRNRGGIKDGIADSSDDDASLTSNDFDSFCDDLDLLSEHLEALEGDVSAGDLEVAPEIDPIEPQILSKDDACELPQTSGHPVIDKSNWRSPSDKPDDLKSKASTETKTSIAEECRRALARLREYTKIIRERLMEPIGQMNQERSDQPELKANFNSELDKVREERDAFVREREARIQSARSKAYALQAAGKYQQAAYAYQDYFELLENKSSDIATLQASRECERQAEYLKNQSQRRKAALILLVMLLSVGFMGSIYIANNTVVSARIASANADLETLGVYCERLASPFIRMGSYGAVTYMYGPEIDLWKNQIEAGDQHNLVSDEREVDVPVVEPVEIVADDAEISPSINDSGVIGYDGLPLLAFENVPSGDGALIYNRQTMSSGNEHLEFLLNPDRSYWVSLDEQGFSFYSEPVASILREINTANARRTRNAGVYRLQPLDINMHGPIAMHELLQLMENYEKRELLKKWRKLGGSRKELNQLSR